MLNLRKEISGSGVVQVLLILIMLGMIAAAIALDGIDRRNAIIGAVLAGLAAWLFAGRRTED